MTPLLNFYLLYLSAYWSDVNNTCHIKPSNQNITPIAKNYHGKDVITLEYYILLFF